MMAPVAYSSAQTDWGIRLGGVIGYRKVYDKLLLSYFIQGNPKIYTYSTKALKPSLSVYTNITLSNNFLLTSEIGYQGMEAKDPSYATSYNYGYLLLPIGIGYKANERFRISIGPYFGYQIAGNVPKQSKTDLGCHFSASYYIDKIEIGVRYFNGLTSIGTPSTFYASATKTVAYDYEVYNRSLQFFAGYRFLK